MSENETSLGDLFKSAKAIQEDLDVLDPRSVEFKQLLQSTISTLQQCQTLVDRLALFSTNEDLDDISTNDVQYLSIDYALAELTMKSYSTTDRKGQLESASQLLEKFLTRLDEYNMLKPSDTKLFQAYKDDRRNFRIVSESAGLETKRNIKIKRFQEEKQLKSRLKLMREQSQSQILNIDDETTRSLYLAELDFYVHQTFASLDLISQERTILASLPSQPDPSPQIAQSPSDLRSRQHGFDKSYSDRLDSPSLLNNASSNRRAILDPQGRPLQPFTLTTRRTDLQKGVFRPGHSLPTMSIDEYLEEDRRRGGIIEGGGNAGEAEIMPDEDDMKAVDEATMKARQWDEYVEANAKGSGNTLNRG